MPQIFKPQNSLQQISTYLCKVPPIGDFATMNGVTPFATYVDNFYPSKGFESCYDKIQKITQSLGDVGLENQIAPTMGEHNQVTQNSIRSITDKVINYTDGTDLSTMIRTSLRMQYVLAVENILAQKNVQVAGQNGFHVEQILADGVNSQDIVRVLASLDAIQLADNQMSNFKTTTLQNVTTLMDVVSQSAPELIPALLSLINLTESYFQLVGITKEIVAAAKTNEQPAVQQMSSVGAGMVQDMSNIIPIIDANKTVKLSAAQSAQSIQNISDIILQSSAVNVNGQLIYTVNKDLIDQILYSYATDQDLLDLEALSKGSDLIRNPIDMYKTVVAYNNAVPIENQDLMVQNPWYQLMLLNIARLHGQALSQTQNLDLMIATANIYNEISLYAKIQITGNQTNIEECLRTDIALGSKICTLSLSAALGGNSSLNSFADKFLGVGMNGVSMLSPQNMIAGIKATNAAFQPGKAQAKDVEYWLGLGGVSSNIMPDTTIKEEVTGALAKIIRDNR